MVNDEVKELLSHMEDGIRYDIHEVSNQLKDMQTEVNILKRQVSNFEKIIRIDHLWELWEGVPFHEDGIERDRLAMCLVYSMGLRHFVKLLPEQSRDALRMVLDEAQDQ
ncbi:hypothetical protein Alches_12390 [Alicyclobacillus hesperidum subsp. aegles]|uniref:hypothetical protein n=1 Tax=Alicyclobacillus hesperidum TaxID=89784 RepID=UPI00222BA449|nr:hypothetical protein [Alicyclobacillus hesperidum]GLG01200.1 hypothetical protein Alches_12390 [Alicyclobacillus hesperidum subsp. aegles]